MQKEPLGNGPDVSGAHLRDRSRPRPPGREGSGRRGQNQRAAPDRESPHRRPPDQSGRDGRRLGQSAGDAGPRRLRPEREPARSQASRRGRGKRDGRPAIKPFQIKGDLLYGRNAILESLRSSNRAATRLWVAEGLRHDDRIDEIVSLARAAEVLLDYVPRSLLDDMEPEVNHQGVLLETPEFPYADLEDVIEKSGTVLVLDHLADPQNFGTLLRAGDAASIAGAVIPVDRSASISPAVVNSSSGAVEHMDIALVPNIGRALDKLEQSGRWIIGLDEGDDAQNLFTTDIPLPVALVVGSEGSGLAASIRKRCQIIVRLPMAGSISSLNAATAGSIALFDIVRRQTPDPIAID